VHRYNQKPGEHGICGTCGRDAEWHVLQSYAFISALRNALGQATTPDDTSQVTDQSLPKVSLLAQIMGTEWMKQESRRVSGMGDLPHPVWYEQADVDLTVLADKVPVRGLASCYRPRLRDRRNFIDAVYAIHGAALLAGIGQRVDLRVPRGPNETTGYDVRVEIDGVPVQAAFRARGDELGLERHRKHSEGTSGSTQSMPPDDTKHPASRESTVVRQLLESALADLPDAGVNIVLFAQIEGSRSHLEQILFKHGSDAASLTSRVTTMLRGSRGRPAEPTVFGDARFARLSGVLWMRLLHLGGPLRPYYNLYVNPNAAVPIPRALIATLSREIERRSNGDG
jgi:hypothetical protein